MNTYGIVTSSGEYIDVSKTKRGAKNYATRHGYKNVYIRFNSGYHLEAVAYKIEGIWQDAQNLPTFHALGQCTDYPYDGRYSVSLECSGSSVPMYIIRFCGEYKESSYSLEEAFDICHQLESERVSVHN